MDRQIATVERCKGCDKYKLRGGPRILYFYESWCPPCTAGILSLAKLHTEYPAVDISLISTETSINDVRAHALDNNFSFRIIVDSTGSIVKEWGLVSPDSLLSIPITLFIDGDETLHNKHVGYEKNYDVVFWDLASQWNAIQHLSTFQSGTNSSGRLLRTAVVEFDVDDNIGIENGGQFIASMMSNFLHSTGHVDLYERVLLGKVLIEHSLAETGVIDDQSIVGFSDLYGVNSIITGTMTSFGNIMAIAVRLIDAKTGRIVSTANITISDFTELSPSLEILAHKLLRLKE